MTDDEYLIAERDKRLKKNSTSQKPVNRSTIKTPGSFLFSLLMKSGEQKIPIVCDITDLPYKYGGLITNDLHLKAYFDGEAIYKSCKMFLLQQRTL
ncbi:hypothetical protein N5V81_12765 [Escherichia coli]|nr:hypothetical protein [Escherichia coli]